MTRRGEVIYDERGREHARRIKGWWYRLQTDSIGMPEWAPFDKPQCDEFDAIAPQESA